MYKGEKKNFPTYLGTQLIRPGSGEGTHKYMLILAVIANILLSLLISYIIIYTCVQKVVRNSLACEIQLNKFT
jgi:hypothetical protein